MDWNLFWLLALQIVIGSLVVGFALFVVIRLVVHAVMSVVVQSRVDTLAALHELDLEPTSDASADVPRIGRKS